MYCSQDIKDDVQKTPKLYIQFVTVYCRIVPANGRLKERKFFVSRLKLLLYVLDHPAIGIARDTSSELMYRGGFGQPRVSASFFRKGKKVYSSCAMLGCVTFKPPISILDVHCVCLSAFPNTRWSSYRLKESPYIGQFLNQGFRIFQGKLQCTFEIPETYVLYRCNFF